MDYKISKEFFIFLRSSMNSLMNSTDFFRNSLGFLKNPMDFLKNSVGRKSVGCSPPPPGMVWSPIPGGVWNLQPSRIYEARDFVELRCNNQKLAL